MYQYALVSCGVHNVLTYHCCCPTRAAATNIGSCVRVNTETRDWATVVVQGHIGCPVLALLTV